MLLNCFCFTDTHDETVSEEVGSTEGNAGYMMVFGSPIGDDSDMRTVQPPPMMSATVIKTGKYKLLAYSLTYDVVVV